MARIGVLAVALTATWLIWSGLYKPLILGLGVLSLGITLWVVQRMDLTRKELFALDLVPRMLGFWAWLAKETFKSNLTVARIILSPNLPVSPTMVTIDSPAPGLVGEATLANCITLTPGTLTVDAHEGLLHIHCLTAEGARDMLDSDIGQRVHRAVGDR
ncbi:MAG: hypothetical protein RLZZ385_105 [Pseudomonadota bacterium]|jgi:multicomponent Na+:H+ antiporter subunit E